MLRTLDRLLGRALSWAIKAFLRACSFCWENGCIVQDALADDADLATSLLMGFFVLAASVTIVVALGWAVYADLHYQETCQQRGFTYDECVDKYRASGACKER
jgi:hypothetical protein